MKNKLLLLLIMCMSLAAAAQSDNSVEPVQVAGLRSDFNFDKSWQYLRTEIYPVNFKCLTDAFVKGGLLKSRTYKDISMTTRIEGVNCDDINFLVYNFKRPSSLRKLQLSKVTLFNGVPLYDASALDAVIKFNTVTSRNKYVYKYIAEMLKGVKSIENKNIALGLSCEMGSLLESENESQNYQFSSPISIVKVDDGKYRLHSFDIYMLAPQAHPDSVFTDSLLNTFIVKDKFSEAAIKPFARKDTAYIFVVNYLAPYRSDISNIKEFTPDAVQARLQALKDQGVSPDIYDYEKTLTEYLARYAVLRENVEEAERSSDNAKLLNVLKNYYRLMVKYNLVVEQMEDDSVFQNVFFKNYKYIHDKAENELLRGSDEFLYVRNMADYLLDKKDYTDYKKSLKLFAKYDFSDKEDKTVRKIASMREEAEEICYEDNFRDIIDKINSGRFDNRSSLVADLQKLKIQYRDCKKCVDESDKAIAFGKDKMKADTAKDAFASARRISDSFLVDILTKEDSLKAVLEAYPLEGRPEIIKYQETKFTALQSRRKVLQNRINKDYSNIPNSDLIEVSNEIVAEAKSINDDLESLIETVKPYQPKTEKPKAVGKSDVKAMVKAAKKSIATFNGYYKNPDYTDLIDKKFGSAVAYCNRLSELVKEDFSGMADDELESLLKELEYTKSRLDSEISEFAND